MICLGSWGHEFVRALCGEIGRVRRRHMLQHGRISMFTNLVF